MQTPRPIETAWLDGITSKKMHLLDQLQLNFPEAIKMLFRRTDLICAKSRGNFLEVCGFFSNYDSVFKSMQSNYFNASSPDFQNKVIDICAKLVHAQNVEKVQDTGFFFSIIADEARSSKTEQLSVCLRYAEQLEMKFCVLLIASRNVAGIVEAINKGLNVWTPNSVKTHYSAITGCLREMSNEGDKWSVEANGLHDHMTSMTTMTCVLVFEDILREIHVTHRALQSSNCTLSGAAALTDFISLN